MNGLKWPSIPVRQKPGGIAGEPASVCIQMRFASDSVAGENSDGKVWDGAWKPVALN